MELPLCVDELPTPTAQGSHNSHDFAQENDYTGGADFTMDGYWGLDGAISLVNPTMDGFQYDQMAQLNYDAMNSFNLIAGNVAWFPADQPVNLQMHSDIPPSLSYAQLVHPSMFAENITMERFANLPLPVNQDQSALWPTGQEFGSSPDPINSNSDLNFFDDNGSYSTACSNLYTSSQSSAGTHNSKSQQSKKRRSNSGRNSNSLIARKKLKVSTAAITAQCIACWTSRMACRGPPDCGRCESKCIPDKIYTKISLLDALIFDKWLEKAYEQKRVYPPTHYAREVKVAFLQHHVNGPELEVRCYYYEPDATEPSQTTIYWKEERWKEAHTTAVSLTGLNYNLEPYVENMVDIVLYEACKGPYYIATLFEFVRVFLRKTPIIFSLLKLFTAVKLLKKGWFISVKHPEETLGNSILYAKKAPWHKQIPGPATVQRQLDHMIEVLAAKWEPLICEDWQKIMKTKGKKGWIEMFFGAFLFMHIVEQDAQRLKIHCEEQYSINNWMHPMKPRALVEKAIHFCNTFLTHFRAVSGMKHPLRLDWLPEDTKRLANGNKDIIKLVEGLQAYKKNLDAKGWIGRNPCDTYKPGCGNSIDFTWSSIILDGTNRTIKIGDYLGKF